ncbi:hypothetical protein FOA52_015217 [Chlamydomonas sp. UWO 241]|nr:hypothetical protein FOA52_015217 [Chlamydomonas sp. UWO 241]
MDPPPAEHVDQAGAVHQVIFNQDLFQQVLLAFGLGKSKLRLLCRATRQMVDSHVTGMNTALGTQHGTPEVLVQTMLRLNARCPRLTSLSVRGAFGMNLLSVLLANLPPSLTSLRISADMNDLWVLPAIRPAAAINLTELKICSYNVISIDPVAACTSLRKLTVIEFRRLTDLRPLSSCTQLRELKITGCMSVSDLQPLSSCTQLRELNITGCRSVSDLTPLRECMLLEKLDLHECPAVAAMDPPPAEHAVQADPVHQVLFNQDLFHQVLLALKRTEDFMSDDRGKPKLRLLCWATRQMVDSHVKGMRTSLDSNHGTPDQLVQTMLRLTAGRPRLTSLSVHGASHIDLLSALLANLPPSLTRLWIYPDMDYPCVLPAIRPATAINLTQLDIFSRHVSSIEPLAACTSLRTLRVVDCRRLTDLRPLRSCTQLRELKIAFCRRVSDLWPIRECTLLEKLELYECPAVVSLAPLRAHQLQHLDLSHTGVTDLSPLQGLPALRSLNLLSCEVPNLVPLTSLSALTSLSMPSRYVNGATLRDMPLQVLKQLEELDLSFTNPPDLGPLTACSSLKVLRMKHSKAVQDLSPLTAFANNLTRLVASGCSCLEDISPLGASVKLVDLDLEDCMGIRDLSALPGCTNLTRLTVSGCRSLEDITPLGACISLLDLDLSKCVGIRDLSALQTCSQLKDLDIEGCRGVSRLAPLLNLPQLNVLSINRSVPVVDRAVLAGLPKLRIWGSFNILSDAGDGSEDNEFETDEFEDDEFEDDEFEDDEFEDDEFEDMFEDEFEDEFEDDEF